ncbi:DUF5304 domain-containing protein [Streptomyces sp. G3]|uniref:DUF5304 domain-containing protein n=1 Tax=Streptomyces TaxID=1883 RepID=UPI000C9B116E|nr:MULTISPECIES: DUF5304 domain-containing protein [unclassified Streptomyces]WSU04134.1 DUF5304 domain-containing protein [Streptomyces sp. NBC_01124]MCM1941204.1 DUF5304 domain-containing protein [Streptomyces sp. G3]MCV2461909.1 DUF5304 domain-containing protein [Streptomyces sp. ICN988]MDU0253468.1 DUF5304 domain-containing protein [Streptomyces sp. PU10]QUW90835.1 hypothetical protein KE639_02027 [Streptomyces sp. V17-9]
MSEELPPSEAPRPDEADTVDETRATDETRAAGETRATAEAHATDADAWATACAEDLEAEKARRRAEYGPPPGSAAEELRRLVDTVADKLAGLQSPLLGQVAGPAAQQVVRQVVQQAKAAVEPVIERNPDVFDHLAAAGGELLAAYRSAVQNQERRWTTGDTAAKDPSDPRDQGERGTDGRDEDDGGTGPGQRIDLD